MGTLPHHACWLPQWWRYVQEAQVLDSIADYFHHTIAEVPHDNEDKFCDVLIEAGLSRGMD